MSKTKDPGHSNPEPAIPWGRNVLAEASPVDKVIPTDRVKRAFWNGMLRHLRRGGIRRRLLLWGLNLFGIALLIVVAAGYFYMARQIRQDTAALQSEIASVTAGQIRNFVQRKFDRFSDTAAALSLYPLGSNEQQLLLGLLVKNDNSFTHASIINSEGMEVVKVSDRKVYFPSDLKDQSKSDNFVKALTGQKYVSPVHTSAQAQPYVTLAIPLWGAGQSIAGVVSAEADLSFLWDVVGNIRFGAAGYAYIVDEHGNLIAHKDSALVLKRLNLRNLDGVKNFLLNPTRSDLTPAHEGRGLTDSHVLVTYAPVPELGWSVILEEPVNAALANVEILKRSALVFLVVGLLVGAAVIAWVSRKITKPIQELRQNVATIGAGNLEHRANIKTGDEIEELATEFNKMTGALQNSYATLEQKVDQRTKEIAALYSVTTMVNQSLSLTNIFDEVIAKIAEMFRFESTRVYLFNDEVNELELRASFEGNLKHSSVTHIFKRGEGIVGRVAESGEPMIFEDTSTDTRYAALSATKTKHSAKQSFFAVFPIKTKSRVFGTILFNAIAPRKLTSDETRLLTSITEQLAVAVEKASLFRESEARSQQLTVLNKIGAAVGQSLNLDTVLNEAIEKMTESLNFDASWIYVLDPSGEELCLKAYKGLAQDVAQAIERRGCSAGVSGKIFMTGEKLVFEDYQTDKNYNDLTPSKRIRSLGFASGAGFPIKAKDRVIGVLHLANKARRHFTHDDLQLIESIAQEIGVATENARLFEQVNLKTEELGKMNQDLNEANKAKSEFISAMSHELRTPLNVIMGNAELTGDGFWGEINPEQKKSMTQIQHHSRFLLKLVNNVLALSSLDAKKISLELATVKIDELVAHAKSHVEQLNRSKTLAISWNVGTDIPDIVTDETKLEEILQNLIGNAFKFTPQGGIDVEIKNLAEQKRVEFRVADTGIGIETHDLDRIFGAFEQIKEAHTGEFNGVGLGLNIVKKYLDLMKGDIRVESRPGKGTTFTFSVPHSISMPA